MTDKVFLKAKALQKEGLKHVDIARELKRTPENIARMIGSKGKQPKFNRARMLKVIDGIGKDKSTKTMASEMEVDPTTVARYKREYKRLLGVAKTNPLVNTRARQEEYRGIDLVLLLFESEKDEDRLKRIEEYPQQYITWRAEMERVCGSYHKTDPKDTDTVLTPPVRAEAFPKPPKLVRCVYDKREKDIANKVPAHKLRALRKKQIDAVYEAQNKALGFEYDLGTWEGYLPSEPAYWDLLDASDVDLDSDDENKETFKQQRRKHKRKMMDTYSPQEPESDSDTESHRRKKYCKHPEKVESHLPVVENTQDKFSLFDSNKTIASMSITKSSPDGTVEKTEVTMK
jgi:hypothetical protein